VFKVSQFSIKIVFVPIL